MMQPDPSCLNTIQKHDEIVNGARVYIQEYSRNHWIPLESVFFISISTYYKVAPRHSVKISITPKSTITNSKSRSQKSGVELTVIFSIIF